MSTINDALSKLTEKDNSATSQIERIEVKPIRQFKIWPWTVGVSSLLLAVGGWAFVASQNESGNHSQATNKTVQAVEHQATEKPESAEEKTKIVANVTSEKTAEGTAKPMPASSPTIVATPDVATVYTAKEVAPIQPKKAVKPHVVSPKETAKQTKATQTASAVKPAQSQATQVPPVQAITPAVAPATKKTTITTPTDGFVIEHVELTHRQLADKAIEEAQKALDANNIKGALKEYSAALRYVPTDEVVRQKLAALYYGRGDARKAFELLQQGIQLNKSGENLRLALAKLLLKEDRAEAALVPLVYLPANPTTPYLSLRAALAQKNNQDAVALETYQMLVTQDSSNGRWWLGLAIQQERNLDMKSASKSYQNALTRVGISKSSQKFIRERLKLLSSLEGGSSAN